MNFFGGKQRREFERLAKPLLKPLYHAALRLTRQTEWAEDLTQDTLMRAYERFTLFQPGTNFRAWLFTILTHTYLNDCERIKRRPVTASYDAPNAQGETWDFPAARETTDPARVLLANVMEERIQQALDALGEEFRVAVILVDMEELSYQEASDALGIPLGTIRSRVSRGRAQLRKWLQDAEKANQARTQ